MSLRDVLDVDMACIPMFAAIQRNGLLISPAEFTALDAEFTGKMEDLQADINRLAGRTLNPGSSEQVERCLFKDLGLHRLSPIARQTKASGQEGNPERWSTDHDILMSVIDKHPVVEPLLRWKEYQKLVTTYLRVLPKMVDGDGRVRSKSLRITRTATGRPSMSEPNLLTVPIRSEDARRLRRGFVAPPGKKLVEVDLSQIEMRVGAHESQDPVMCAILHDGGDIHQEAASTIFEVPTSRVDDWTQRQPAKTVGFGILFLISADGLLRQLITTGLKGWTEAKCLDLIEGWHRTYQGIAPWQDHVKATARRYGRVEDMWGGVRLIPEVVSVFKHIREAGLRRAVNAPIQMGAAGVMKRIMVRVWKELEAMEQGVCNPLLQIYDSLLFEIKKPLAEALAASIRDTMEHTVRLSVPIKAKAEMGENWGEMGRVA